MDAPGTKRAAIDPDALGERTLGEITAADFLHALNAGAIGPLKLFAWPEKKKVELELEPQNYGAVRLKDFVGVFREKKKVELEKDPRPEVTKSLATEVSLNPRDLIRDPSFISEVAREVAAQLRLTR